MTVFYVARKKVFRVGNKVKELFYATPKAIQRKAITERELADDLADRSSLSAGDVLSVLQQLPLKIVDHLKDGRTVTIEGLGTFHLSLTSEGVERPEECRPNKLRSYRICYRADKKMKTRMKGCDFELVDWKPEKRENRKRKDE